MITQWEIKYYNTPIFFIVIQMFVYNLDKTFYNMTSTRNQNRV